MLAEELGRADIDLKPAQGLLKELGVEKVVARVERGAYTVRISMWNGVEIPFDLAPSGIREALTPVLALLATAQQGSRDVLKRIGFTIIIEEPEAHLHPAAVREFVRVIAYSVNRSPTRFVAVSSHSDVFTSEVSLLIRASSLDDEALRKLRLSGEVVLQPSLVSAYLVKRSGTRSEVEPLRVDVNGIADEDLARVVEELVRDHSLVELWRSAKQ